jgi:TonB family protein
VAGGGGTGVDAGDPDFSEYFRLIEKRVRAAWKFPESLGGTTQTVKIGFALAPEGSLRDARVVSSSSSTLNDSALSAMRRAAPFPPLPAKFRGLAGQPLVMSFTVTIR